MDTLTPSLVHDADAAASGARDAVDHTDAEGDDVAQPKSASSWFVGLEDDQKWRSVLDAKRAATV